MRLLGWLIAAVLIAGLALLALLRFQPELVPAAVSERVPQPILSAVQGQTASAVGGSAAPDRPQEPADPAQGPKIYAWKDDQGRWHYTDTPPSDRPYQTRQYREDVNVVPAYTPDPDG